MRPRLEKPMLVSDKILLVLNGGGPQSYAQIASVLNIKVGGARVANNFNRNMLYTESLGNPMNRFGGAVKIKITEAGKGRIEKVMLSRYTKDKLPNLEYNKYRDTISYAVLLALRKGPLPIVRWEEFCKSKASFQEQIYKLRRNGFTIDRSLDGRKSVYHLKAEPKELT